MNEKASAKERNLNYKSEIFPSYHYGKKLFANFSPIKTSEDGSIEVDGKKTRNLTKAFWIVSLQAFDREREVLISMLAGFNFQSFKMKKLW